MFFLFMPLLLSGTLTCSLQSQASPLSPDITAQPLLTGNTLSKTYTFKQLGWNNALTLNSYKPNYTVYLPIPAYLHAQKATVHLKMAFSPSLAEGSLVEVTFNQASLQKLTIPSNPSRELTGDIDLPLTSTGVDWQPLTFSAYFNSTKNACDPNTWVYVSPESTLTLTYPQLPFNGLLNELPFPFINPFLLKPTSTLLALPNKPALHEVIALLQVAFRLGQLSDGNSMTVTAGMISELTEQFKENNALVIGTTEQLLNTDQSTLKLPANPEIDTALKNQFGILFLDKSPYNAEQAVLTITGSTETALEKAVSAFLTPEFPSLAAGNLAIIDKIQTDLAQKPAKQWDIIPLKSLGYADQSVSGLGSHTVSYDIPLPNDKAPNHATITTLITAPIFKGDYSEVTVLVNGLKQSSFELKEEHSSWSALIEGSALKPGLNKLQYLFSLHRGDKGTEECSRKNFDEVWATIHAETRLETTFSSAFPLATLNELPVPFANEVTLILPAQWGKGDLANLSKLFFKLGQLFLPDTVHFTFQSSAEVDEGFLRTHNIVLYGLPETNPWIQWAMDYLPVQLKGKARVLKLPQKQLELTSETPTGLVELLPSPWSEKHAVLLITASSQEALQLAIHPLITDKTRQRLNGNIVVVNSPESLEILNSFDARFISLPHRISLFLSNTGSNLFYYLKTHLQIFIYLIALIVPIVIFMRQRKK
jgi:hypothetical protein